MSPDCVTSCINLSTFNCVPTDLKMLTQCSRYRFNELDEKTDVSPLLGFKSIKMSVNTITNQRKITRKINKAELWFLCMIHHLIVLYDTLSYYAKYNCMKFHSNIIAITVFNLQRGHETALHMIKGK